MAAAQSLIEADQRAAHATAPDLAEVADLADVERELSEHQPTPRDVKGKGRESARDATAFRDEDRPRTPRITLNDEELPGSHWGSSPPTPPRSERAGAAPARTIPRPRDVVHSPTLTARRKRRRREFWRAAVVPLVYIALWYLFSTLLSVYNKWMFDSSHYGFRYPLFVSSCHMVVQSGLSALVLLVVPSLRPATRPKPRDYLSKAAPCAVATGLDIGLSNLSLKTITLSFYTMCKSSSLGFVLLFAFLFHLEKPTWKLVGIIAIITAGVIMMVSAETQFDLFGMIAVLSASACGGLRWSLTQLLLDKKSMGMTNPIATLFWLCPLMAVTLGILSLIFEGPFQIFAQEQFFGTFALAMRTSALILFPGCLAFFMTASEFALIQRTSVVTLSVAGIFKEIATIFVSTTLFKDRLTPINISGLCVALVGIACYNWLKWSTFRKSTADKSPMVSSASHEANGGPVSPSKPALYNMAQESGFFVAESRLSIDSDTMHTLGDDSDSDDGHPGDDEGAIRLLPRHRESASAPRVLDEVLADDRLAELDREASELEASMDRASSAPDQASGWEHVLADSKDVRP